MLFADLAKNICKLQKMFSYIFFNMFNLKLRNLPEDIVYDL